MVSCGGSIAAVIEAAADANGLSVIGHGGVVAVGGFGDGIGLVVKVDSSKARHLKSFL